MGRREEGSLRDGKLGVGRGRGVLPGGGWEKGWGGGRRGHCVTASLGLGVGEGFFQGEAGGRVGAEGGGGFRGEGWGGWGAGKEGVFGGRDGGREGRGRGKMGPRMREDTGRGEGFAPPS